MTVMNMYSDWISCTPSDLCIVLHPAIHILSTSILAVCLVEHKFWCPLQYVHISSLKRSLWWEPSYDVNTTSQQCNLAVSRHLVSSGWSNMQNNALRWLLRFYISSQLLWPLLLTATSKQHEGLLQGLQEALEANWLKFRDQGIVLPEFLLSSFIAC